MPEILVADDPQLLLALEDSLVRRAEFHVRTVADGAAALAAAHARKPALLVLDARMPELSGFEVCRQMKAEPALAGLPVILAGEARDLPRIVEAGADGRVARPVAAADLRQTIGRLLGLTDRSQPRRPSHLRVDYYGSAREGTAYTRDIAGGGLFLRHVSLVPGEQLQVIFELPLEAPATVRATGRVTRVEPGRGAALEFRGIGSADREAIAEFVTTAAVA